MAVLCVFVRFAVARICPATPISVASSAFTVVALLISLQRSPDLLGVAYPATPATAATVLTAVNPEDLLLRSARWIIRQLLPDEQLVVARRKRHCRRLRVAPFAVRVGGTPCSVV